MRLTYNKQGLGFRLTILNGPQCDSYTIPQAFSCGSRVFPRTTALYSRNTKSIMTGLLPDTMALVLMKGTLLVNMMRRAWSGMFEGYMEDPLTRSR